jgi:hypothetical protein
MASAWLELNSLAHSNWPNTGRSDDFAHPSHRGRLIAPRTGEVQRDRNEPTAIVLIYWLHAVPFHRTLLADRGVLRPNDGIIAGVTSGLLGDCAEAGVSMAYTWDKDKAVAPSTRTTQYFEMIGNRAATTPPAPPWLMGAGQDAGSAERV